MNEQASTDNEPAIEKDSCTGTGIHSLIGERIDGKYQVLAKLGSGGMGAVYRAEHVLIGRTVAIKVLHPHLVEDEGLLQRFHHEAKVTSRLEHPNAVAVLDFGIWRGAPYLVMEFAEGVTLKERMTNGLVPLHEMRAIFLQVTAALAKAHDMGIVHRDLKPDNIMLTQELNGELRVRVLDFGIAKVLHEKGEKQAAAVMTQVGTFFGTPKYASPEQAVQGSVDGRSDVYTLGVILYEVICGVVPFDAPSVVEVLMKQLTEAPQPLSQRSTGRGKLPEALCRLVMRCLEKEPSKRYQAMGELHRELSELALDPPSARWHSTAAAVFGSIAALAIWVQLRHPQLTTTIWHTSPAPTEQHAESESPAAPTAKEYVPPTSESPVIAAEPHVVPPAGPARIDTDGRPNPFLALAVQALVKTAVQQVSGSGESVPQAGDPEIPAVVGVSNGERIGSNETHEPAELHAVKLEPPFPAETKPSTEIAPAAPDRSADTQDERSTGEGDLISADELLNAAPEERKQESPPEPALQVAALDVTRSPETAAVPSTRVVEPAPAPQPKIGDGKKQAIAMYAAGRDLLRQKRYAEAAAKFEQAVQYRSDAIGSFISLGNCYDRLGQNDRALAALQSAVRIDGSYAPAQYSLATFLATHGRTEEAMASLQRAVRLDSRVASVARADEAFAAVRREPGFQQALRGSR